MSESSDTLSPTTQDETLDLQALYAHTGDNIPSSATGLHQVLYLRVFPNDKFSLELVTLDDMLGGNAIQGPRPLPSSVSLVVCDWVGNMAMLIEMPLDANFRVVMERWAKEVRRATIDCQFRDGEDVTISAEDTARDLQLQRGLNDGAVLYVFYDEEPAGFDLTRHDSFLAR